MKQIIALGFLLLPFLGFGQVADTVAVRREVDSLIQVSRALTGKGEFDKALEVNTTAEKLALEKFGRESASYGSTCFNHGRVLHFKGDFHGAEKWYLESKDIRKKVLGKGHPEYGWSLNNLANLYSNIGNYEKAEPLYVEALAIREKVLSKEHPDYASSLNNLGILYKNIGTYSKAESLLLEAKAIREKILGKEHPDYVGNLINLGNLYSDMGVYEKAEPLYFEAKIIQEKTLGKEHPHYGRSLNNLASLYSNFGNYEKAEPLMLEAISYLEKNLGKENPDYAMSLSNLGSVYFEMGAYEKAEPLYLEAKIILEKTMGKEHPDYAWILNSLGTLYRVIGAYKKSEVLYLEAISIREKKLKKEHPDYAKSLSDLGVLYKIMGAYEKSESLYLEAQTICLKTLGKEHPCYITSLINLGNLYSIMGNYEMGLQHHIEVIAIREKNRNNEHPDYVASLNYLGLWYWSRGVYEKAESFFREAKAIEEKTLSRERPGYTETLINLSVLYDTQNKFIESELLLKEFAELKQSQFSRSVTFLSEREIGAYAATFQEDGDRLSSFLFGRLVKNKSTDMVTSLCLDHSLFQKGFLLEAASRLNRLASFSHESEEIYLRLKGCRRRLSAEYAKPVHDRNNLLELEERANTLEKELVRKVPGYAEAIRQVKWQEVQSSLNAGEVAIEFVHFQNIYHHFTDSTLYAAFLLLPGDTAPHFIPLCEQRQLDTLIPEREGPMHIYIQNLYALSRPDGLASLYQLLWAPIDTLLHEHGIQTVYYSPSGLLHRLNLGALTWDKSGKTLADRYRFVLLGSTRELTMPDRNTSKPKPSSAMVYGGIRYDMDTAAIARANRDMGATAQDTTGGLFRYSPHNTGQATDTGSGNLLTSEPYRGDNFEPLPGSEREARHLYNLLRQQGVSATLRLGHAATEESFKQIGQNGPSPTLLHIGTHGFFFPDPTDTSRSSLPGFGDDAPAFKISEHPLIRSGLKLAGSQYAWENKHPMPNMEDGILTAHEVSQMNLSNTELVVLSACETGLGDIKGNEGVYGLQRAFRIAGAKNVLMSLWKVPDDVTEMLMTRFYQNWLEEKMPLREAFEKAQKWLRDLTVEKDGVKIQYNNPYFWAGFVLIGE